MAESNPPGPSRNALKKRRQRDNQKAREEEAAARVSEIEARMAEMELRELVSEAGSDSGSKPAPIMRDCMLPLYFSNPLYSFRMDDRGWPSVHAVKDLPKGARILEEEPMFIHHHQAPFPVTDLRTSLLQQLLSEQIEGFVDLGMHDSVLRIYNHVRSALAHVRAEDLQSPEVEDCLCYKNVADILQVLIDDLDVEGLSQAEATKSEIFELQMHSLAVWQSNRRFFDGVITFGSFVGDHVSKLRHSCRPNAEYVYNEETGNITVHAINNIDAGEEITISYLHHFVLLQHKLVSGTISCYTMKAGMYAIDSRPQASYRTLQTAYKYIVLTHGRDHPYTRKILYLLKRLFSLRSDVDSYKLLFFSFGAPKTVSPAAGALAEMIPLHRDDKRKSEAEAALTTADKEAKDLNVNVKLMLDSWVWAQAIVSPNRDWLERFCGQWIHKHVERD
ncbi:hypothetical protein CAC42_104 [Sphaceloma murrayae]|uniref:SET domain-containing protein n=1 Tax=Sphaceloma murrayae TaxID=2082308 RepID=A0A2K1QND6_9PEZI|nr:hypothetical protein CAC42_104 [Sphaceloma murrayae]